MSGQIENAVAPDNPPVIRQTSTEKISWTRAALIGAGKFGSMFLSQVPTIPALEVTVIADLDPEHARSACRAVGWEETRIGRTRFTESGIEACAETSTVLWQ